jgi:hypothetical protein
MKNDLTVVDLLYSLYIFILGSQKNL